MKMFAFIIISTLIASSIADNGFDLIQEQPLTTPYPNVTATSVILTFPPGDSGSPPHYHSGPVTGYVIEGEFLMQLSGQKHKILQAGSAFYEKDRAIHVWGGNASNNSTCKVLATVYGRPGEQVLTFLKDWPRESRRAALIMAKLGI